MRGVAFYYKGVKTMDNQFIMQFAGDFTPLMDSLKALQGEMTRQTDRMSKIKFAPEVDAKSLRNMKSTMDTLLKSQEASIGILTNVLQKASQNIETLMLEAGKKGGESVTKGFASSINAGE